MISLPAFLWGTASSLVDSTKGLRYRKVSFTRVKKYLRLRDLITILGMRKGMSRANLKNEWA